MWLPLLPALKGRDVIIPDLPAHGASPWDESWLSMSFMTNSLLELMSELNRSVVHVVGHSMGGYIAMEMLHKAPHQIGEVALFQSTATNDDDERKTLRNRAIAAVLENQKLYVRGMITGLFSPERRTSYDLHIETLVENANQLNPNAIASALKGMRERNNHLDTAIKMRSKISFFTGAEDPRLKLDEMLREHEKVGYKMFMSAPKCGHMAHIEAPIWGQNFLNIWSNDLS